MCLENILNVLKSIRVHASHKTNSSDLTENTPRIHGYTCRNVTESIKEMIVLLKGPRNLQKMSEIAVSIIEANISALKGDCKENDTNALEINYGT